MIIDEILNIACLAFTIAGAYVLGNKGDKLYGWMIYTIAAMLGIIYFIILFNPIQLLLWSFFLVNDLLAIRRLRKKRDSNA